MKRLLALHHAVGHVGVFLSVLGVESRDLPVISTGSSVYCLPKVLGLEPCNQNKRSFNKGYVGVSSRQQPAAPQKKSEHESERNLFFCVVFTRFLPPCWLHPSLTGLQHSPCYPLVRIAKIPLGQHWFGLFATLEPPPHCPREPYQPFSLAASQLRR